MAGGETGARPGGRSARVRRDVLNATLDALQQVGFDRVSIAEVARRAGVHETSIYRRWRTRENLVLDALVSSVEDAVAIPDTGTLAGDLVAILEAIVRRIRSPLGSSMLALTVRSFADPRGQDLREAYWSSALERAQPILRRAVDRGELRADVPARHLLELVVAPIYLRTLMTGDPIDHDFLAGVVATVLRGVGAQGSVD